MFPSWWLRGATGDSHAKSQRRARRRPKPFQPTVEALEPRWVPSAVITVTGNGDDTGTLSGSGAVWQDTTLRGAILAANSNSVEFAVSNTIVFDISSGGSTVISPASPLPLITRVLTIDGFSQQMSSSNPNVIVISGGGQTGGVNGLEVNETNPTTLGTNSVIEGLVIQGFSFGSAIALDTGNNLVQDNFIGSDVSGGTAVPNDVGITVTGSGNTIGGNAPPSLTSSGGGNLISGNFGDGVRIFGSGATGNLVEGNYIGTDASGTTGLGNFTGVEISNGASGNTVGGVFPTARNVISGNANSGGTGVFIHGSGTNNNAVEGNYIGTDVFGTTAVPNDIGVEISGFSGGTNGNTIGGLFGGGNLISGNTGDGVLLQGSGVFANVVEGNLIGTVSGGTDFLPNGTGVEINGAHGNTIGSASFGQASNVISGNDGDGVLIRGSGATGNLVEGNFIGLNAAGNSSLGNNIGVEIVGAGSNVVGDGTPGTGNVISGNTAQGVYIHGSGAGNNLVQGNFIGTDPNGAMSLANGVGVEIDGTNLFGSSTDGNTIGGTSLFTRNIISGNTGDGVFIHGSGATNTVFEGNYIGTDRNGMTAIPNDTGVDIEDGASGTLVGGPQASGGGGFGPGPLPPGGNLISGNTNDGVLIQPGSTFINPNFAADGNASPLGSSFFGSGLAPSNNTVEGNFIGTDFIGFGALPNGGNGVEIDDADDQGNVVGGTDPADGNLIAANGGDGVLLFKSFSRSSGGGNSINGILVGPDSLVENNTIGGPFSALGNGGAGVVVAGSQDNLISANSIFNNQGNAAGGIILTRSSLFGPIGNDNQPAPTLSSVTGDNSGTITVTGTIADSNDPVTVELFSSQDGDQSGVGQGETFLKSITLPAHTTDFSFQVTNFQTKGQLFFTATATDQENTSEFSNWLELQAVSLIISETVDDATPAEGQLVNFTITVTNFGPSAATNLVIADVLPPGVTYVSDPPSQGTFDSQTGLWSVGTLLPASSSPAGIVGGTATLVITARVDPGTAGTLIVNPATIASVDQPNLSSSGSQAHASITPVGGLADLLPPTQPGPGAPPSPVNTTPSTLQDNPFVPASVGQVLIPNNGGGTGTSEHGDSGADFSLGLLINTLEVRAEQTDTLMNAAAHALALADLPPPAQPSARAGTAGAITGMVFEDTNGDGMQQPNEPALEGMKVFLSTTKDAEFSEDMPWTTTDSSGRFRFTGLLPGVYYVRTVPHHIYQVTFPDPGGHQVLVTPDSTVTVTFGCRAVRPKYGFIRAVAALPPATTGGETAARGPAHDRGLRDTLFSRLEDEPGELPFLAETVLPMLAAEAPFSEPSAGLPWDIPSPESRPDQDIWNCWLPLAGAAAAAGVCLERRAADRRSRRLELEELVARR
jgi:uncharacterized repeat protein (TIGR01451 family)